MVESCVDPGHWLTKSRIHMSGPITTCTLMVVCDSWILDTDVSAVDQPKHPREACVMLRRKRARGRMAASASAHAETRGAAAAAHLQQLAVRRPLDVVTEE